MKQLNIKQSIAALLLVVSSFLLSATPPHFTPSFALQELSYQDERVLFSHSNSFKEKKPEPPLVYNKLAP